MQHKKDSKGNTTQIPGKNLLQQGKYLFPTMNPVSLGLHMPDNMRLQSDTISNKQQDVFSTILSSMKDMVFIMDTENRILYMNKSAIDEYGVSLGKYCHQVICNSEVACQQTGMEAILKGQTVQLERTIKGKVYDSLVVPFVYRNNEIYKMEILRDITGRKQLQDELEKLSITDKLTGLYNRRYFDDILGKEILRTKRLHHDLSLLFIDIDKFKHFNDTYGHAMGDKVLQRLGGVINEQVRKGIDLPCRYGGEEFTIILPETLPWKAIVVANRILKSFRNVKFHIPENDEAVQKTISIGVAGIGQYSNLSARSLLVHADKAMYNAKKLGGNRVCEWKVSGKV